MYYNENEVLLKLYIKSLFTEYKIQFYKENVFGWMSKKHATCLGTVCTILLKTYPPKTQTMDII